MVKVLVGLLLFFVLCIGLAIGGAIYVGYRVKKKAEQFASELKQQAGGSLPQSGSSAMTGPDTAAVESCPAVDAAQASEFRKSAAAASIPLKPGMTLVDVYTNQQLGGRDVEVLKTVSSIDDNTVRISASRTDGTVSSSRVLCINDLLKGRQYETGWGTNIPDTISGATMFTMSRAVFDDMKAGRPAELEYFQVSGQSAGRYRKGSGGKGTLTRVEAEDVPYSLIVNGEKKDVPAIHVKGMLGTHHGEAYVLDEPANPIMLSWRLPEQNFHLNYLKVTYPEEKKIEQTLSQGRCAAVYGIYFDFNSAQLRSESEPALKEIAQALSSNPAWKVLIEGHTDNVGGDAYNQKLSAKRADSVKVALVEQYSLAEGRLSTSGFGASKPKAPNDTTEGRALNRRVELCRQ